MGSTTEYETHLQALAEHVTEEGLNFVGAEFDHLETGESFTVTVAKTSTVKELNDRVKLLEDALSQALNELRSYEKTAGKMPYTRSRKKFLKLLTPKPA